MSDPAAAHRLALYAALTDADLPAAWAATRALLDEGLAFEAIVAQALAPAQREVGARWAANDTGVAEEHAATATLQQLVTLLTASTQPNADPRGEVVVACAEGDHHALAAQLVAASLHLRGWHTVFLGSSMPALELGVFVAQRSPTAVAVSCSHPRALLGARHSIDAVRAFGVPVIAGGRAFGSDDQRAHRLGANAWAGSATAAGDLLDAGLPDAPPAADLPVVADQLAEVAGLVAEVSARAGEVGPLPLSGSEFASELRATLDVLASALLLDELSLATEYVQWQLAMLDTRGVARSQIMSALHAAAAHPEVPHDAQRALSDVVASLG